MNNYKVIYNTLEGTKAINITAKDKQQAYARFKNSSLATFKVVNIVKQKSYESKQSSIIVISMIIVAAFLVGFFIGCFVELTPDVIGVEEYVVRSGDTIWELASMSDGYGEVDTRIIVKDIMLLSDCSETIQSGRTIYIPIYFN